MEVLKIFCQHWPGCCEPVDLSLLHRLGWQAWTTGAWQFLCFNPIEESGCCGTVRFLDLQG
jgi:hypothetical protein